MTQQNIANRNNIVRRQACSPLIQLLFGFASEYVRDGFKKSKWKFKMAFAMKGGGSRGGLECHIPNLKNDFC